MHHWKGTTPYFSLGDQRPEKSVDFLMVIETQISQLALTPLLFLKKKKFPKAI